MTCDRDCFNCKYDDCIVDEVDFAELKESKVRDAEALFDRKDNVQKRDYLNKKEYQRLPKAKEKARAYYEKNREKKIEYQREYREKHRDELAYNLRLRYAAEREKRLEYQRNYYQEHKERHAEYCREYYRKNRDAILARKKGATV